MKVKHIMALIALSTGPLLAAPEYRQMGPDIFDPKAKAEKLVNDAVAQSGPENKRVLLLFGANWCPWCRTLHRVLTTDTVIAESLRRSFVLVPVDANTRNDRNRNAAVVERYGNPLQHGLPVFVVLDSDGTQLTTRETASLSATTELAVAIKVRAFLAEWAK